MFFKKKKNMEKNRKRLEEDIHRGFEKMDELFEEIKEEKKWKKLEKLYEKYLKEMKAQGIRLEQYIERKKEELKKEREEEELKKMEVQNYSFDELIFR